MALRWGIIGASQIANDFCVVLDKFKISNVEHRIVAIASKSRSKAEKFAETHKIDKVYYSYESLGKDEDIEVVYVTVLNFQHYEICKMMLNYKKHVVCEKPLAMNPSQVKQILDLALERCVFAMESVSSRFFPLYRHLAHLMKYKCMGESKEIYIKHGFKCSDKERIVRKQLGGGIVLDIGTYAIQFITFIFGKEMPNSIKATGKINSDGVDLYFKAELKYSGGRKALIVCSGLEDLENQATIITTKGPIYIPNYWCPTKYIDAYGQWHKWNLPELNDNELNYKNSLGLKYEADEVAKSIRAGELQCDIISPEDTLIIAKIQYEIRKQLCVQYDCD